MKVADTTLAQADALVGTDVGSHVGSPFSTGADTVDARDRDAVVQPPPPSAAPPVHRPLPEALERPGAALSKRVSPRKSGRITRSD